MFDRYEPVATAGKTPSGLTPCCCAQSFPKGQTQKKQFVHQSTGAAGPWTVVTGGMACNNPSPMLLPNGSSYLVCHNKYNCHDAGVDAWGRRREQCAVRWRCLLDLSRCVRELTRNA